MSDRQIAAFDFDGTLTRRDTLLPFLVRAFGARRVAAAVARVAPVAARARTNRLQDALHHRDAVKKALLRDLFRGRDPGWLAAEGVSFAETLPGRLRPEMTKQVSWHREHGHKLVIVSAGLHAYLEPFGHAEGFDHVIAVELATDPGSRLTGELVSPNVRGAEKARRFQAWLDGDEPAFVWAYGNSAGDTELLDLADVPVWMNRRQKGGLTLPTGMSGAGSPAT